MKNKFRFVICIATSVIMGSTYVNAQNLAVNYDRNVSEIVMSSDIGNEKSSVTVTVKRIDGTEMSKDNLPDFITVCETDENGRLSKKIKMSNDVKSGKYVLYNDSEQVHESAEFMIVNPNDQDTIGVIAAINESLQKSSFEDLYAVLKGGDNAAKIGIDLSDEYVSANLESIAEKCYYEGQGKTYTADSFCSVFEKGIAATQISDKEIAVKDVMLKYAACFGTTYAEYAEIEESERNILDELLKNADYTAYSPEEVYSEKCIVAEIRTCKTWSYLKDEILANYEKIGLDMSANSDYAKISESDVYKVYRDMFADISSFTSFGNIKSSFNKAVQNNKPSSGSSSGSSSSSSSSSSSGGGASSKGSGSNTSYSVTGNVSQNTKKSLSDISNHWGKEYITRLYDMSVVSGYEDGTFKPDGDITRAEFVKIISGLFKIESADKVNFDDIDGSEWYADCIQKAAACGIVNGYDGKFRPLNKITRQDVAVVISKFEDKVELTAGNINTYSDFGEVSEYAADAVGKLAGSDIMVGSDNRLEPQRSITRAEVCKILCMVYDRLK